ncbi:MAG: DUF2490 domain-containing protein [Deltaproteobacteria bacterium]|nr:DUF2490 domain-containing protein [Deltaproteobacteria bacterium]
MRKFRIAITLAIVISIPVLATSGACADFQTWSDIATIYKFNDRWRYDGDQGVRGVLSDSDFTLLYFRPSVRYRAKPWFTVHGGVRFFQTFFDDEDDTFEIGPWQGLRFIWPELGGYAVSHYFRLEERMIWQIEGERDFDFTVRGRYQLGVRSPNYNILVKNGIYLTGSIEAFSNIERPIFVNRMRYDVGAGTKFSDAWRVELHYLLQQGRRSAGSAFSVDEHVLRLRLFYTFN